MSPCPQTAQETLINPGPNTNWLPSITGMGTRASIPALTLGTSNNTQCPWASIPTLVFWLGFYRVWAPAITERQHRQMNLPNIEPQMRPELDP